MDQATEPRTLVVTPASQRAGGIAGIVFAVLIAIDVFAFFGPSFTDPIADIREYFVDDANLILAIALVETLLFAFVFLFFAACLRDTLAWSESIPTEFPRLTFAGAIIAAALGGAASVPWMAVAFSDAAIGDDLLQFVMYMDAMAYGLIIGFAFALMALASSIVILRTNVLARWLGWLGVASAVLLITGSLWVLDGNEEGALAIIGFAGFAAWLLWALGVGIEMVRRSRTT